MPSPRIVNLHSGFDESSGALAQLFPDAALDIYDFYDPTTMTEPSIARARRWQRQTDPGLQSLAQPVAPTALPTGDAAIDAIFLILAAHEVRDVDDRRRMFAEIKRSLLPGGRVVLVEHLRDLANFAVFGPQFVHFYARRTWLDLARGAGLSLVHEDRITPFVRLFVFEKPGHQP